MAKTKHIAEFGDFQTPDWLAQQACQIVGRHIRPAAVLEPTCGVGNFLISALNLFPSAQAGLGLEINSEHVTNAEQAIKAAGLSDRSQVLQEDFFAADWSAVLQRLPDPLLVIGNPPWVTNSALAALGSGNVPTKRNHQNHLGMAALTGKSNFDISEWMLMRLFELLQTRSATIAMLCKTVVARKTLAHAWRNNLGLASAELYRIDAKAAFSAAVDAGLLICNLVPGSRSSECRVYPNLEATSPEALLGFRDGQIIADAAAYDRLRRWRGPCPFVWRSGVKHDCARVMELREREGVLQNGFGEVVDIERDHLYPMLKSSEVARGTEPSLRRQMLVPQRAVGQDTALLRDSAPRVWSYLDAHRDDLARRASSIYRNRPPFSVFGVGPYTFAPWKVAISGFYKQLEFIVVGPVDGQPVVFDDTSYFLPCNSETQARALAQVLNSAPAKEFFRALIFWDSKRPITVDVLSQLNIVALATELGLADEIAQEGSAWTASTSANGAQQLRLNLR